ncbi:hypothetical protein HDU96_004412 [Phlyctochytrium bullatum]|nr:hypothetical protein HDU96_004412 [Phlyctochytrium bullatum]
MLESWDPILSPSAAAFFRRYTGHRSQPSPPAPDSPLTGICPIYPDSSLAATDPVGRDCRIFRVSGFEFCPELKGSSFDALAFVPVLRGTVAQSGITASTFVKFVDEMARYVYEDLVRRSGDELDPRALQRYACLRTALGIYMFPALSATRILHEIDPLEYHKETLPAMAKRPSVLPGPRRKYPLGMVILANGEPYLVANIASILDALDDGNCLILIHVDHNSESLHHAVLDHLTERRNRTTHLDKGNIHMAETRYHGEWGRPVLVWMALNGFFELANMADVDHFINISPLHWPLRRPVDMARMLCAPSFHDKSFVDCRQEFEESAQRKALNLIPGSHNSSESMTSLAEDRVGLFFAPIPTMRSCKNHQWVILSRRAVEHLRTDSRAALILAFSNFVGISDESFFSDALYSSPNESQHILNQEKIVVHFPWEDSTHPIYLTLEHKHMLGDPERDDDPTFYFARKVNATDTRTGGGAALVEWIRTEHWDRAKWRNGTRKTAEAAGVDRPAVNNASVAAPAAPFNVTAVNNPPSAHPAPLADKGSKEEGVGVDSSRQAKAKTAPPKQPAEELHNHEKGAAVNQTQPSPAAVALLAEKAAKEGLKHENGGAVDQAPAAPAAASPGKAAKLDHKLDKGGAIDHQQPEKLSKADHKTEKDVSISSLTEQVAVEEGYESDKDVADNAAGLKMKRKRKLFRPPVPDQSVAAMSPTLNKLHGRLDDDEAPPLTSPISVTTATAFLDSPSDHRHDDHFGDHAKPYLKPSQRRHPVFRLGMVTVAATALLIFIYALTTANVDESIYVKSGAMDNKNWTANEKVRMKNPLEGLERAELEAALKERYFRARGFKYCLGYEKALFDSLAYVNKWGTTVADRNPVMREFVAMVDEKAMEVYSLLKKQHKDLDEADLKSFACYAAADGANEIANASDSRLLFTVDPETYMSQNVPHVIKTEDWKKPTRKFKIAFVIFIEGSTSANLKNLENQLALLDDGSAIFYVSVASGEASDRIYETIRGRITEGRLVPATGLQLSGEQDKKAETKDNKAQNGKADDDKAAQLPKKAEDANFTTPEEFDTEIGQSFSSRVYLSEKRYTAVDTYAGIIWRQLDAYFALLDMAEWNHVINLVPTDFPVMKAKEMTKLLEEPYNQGMSFMTHWHAVESTTWRVLRQHILYQNKRDHHHMEETGLMYPPFYSLRTCEHDRVLILNRDVVERLRQSPKVATALAYAEHYWKPDGLFFCTAILSEPDLVYKVVSHNKHIQKKNDENEPRPIRLPSDMNSIVISKADEETMWLPDPEAPPPFLFSDIDHPGMHLAGGGSSNTVSGVKIVRKREFFFVAGVNIEDSEAQKFVEAYSQQTRKQGFLKLLDQKKW